MGELPEYLDGLPSLCGSEQTVEAAIAAGRDRPVFDGRSSVSIAGIDSAFAVALHMHQPLIPAGGPDPRTAAAYTLGLPRFDGQGCWLGQATCVRASVRVVVSNSSGVM